MLVSWIGIRLARRRQKEVARGGSVSVERKWFAVIVSRLAPGVPGISESHTLPPTSLRSTSTQLVMVVLLMESLACCVVSAIPGMAQSLEIARVVDLRKCD